MLDVAIVGGGLCGLALAADGTPVDLGATWFWPQ
jgi:thioredoxin reductase